MDLRINERILRTDDGKKREENDLIKIYNRKKRGHPAHYKWHIPERYFWINLTNICFNEKQTTAEFRCHSSTLNYEKAKNWILICMAITHYAEHEYRKIFDPKVPISLYEVIKYTYPKNYEEINEYINRRKKHFAKTELTPAQIEDMEYIYDSVE